MNLIVCGKYAFSVEVEKMVNDGNLNEARDLKELPMEVLKILSFNFNTRWLPKVNGWFLKFITFTSFKAYPVSLYNVCKCKILFFTTLVIKEMVLTIDNLSICL